MSCQCRCPNVAPSDSAIRRLVVDIARDISLHRDRFSNVIDPPTPLLPEQLFPPRALPSRAALRLHLRSAAAEPSQSRAILSHPAWPEHSRLPPSLWACETSQTERQVLFREPRGRAASCKGARVCRPGLLRQCPTPQLWHPLQTFGRVPSSTLLLPEGHGPRPGQWHPQFFRNGLRRRANPAEAACHLSWQAPRVPGLCGSSGVSCRPVRLAEGQCFYADSDTGAVL
ncbi:hypothetical protein BDK51DRAFT_48099 [Blyttiomyces helicus]|uniref:Uncharacterized protein n=1 Tax=Blyttiomyces helicus TaxID=388810 RepID=A0A4P9W1T5_9FUNG|nr:hypothetical protein BDK51DRAFT_48099 [Blyttiomyces helicus]|eukprot:RKO85325.1 hypothetical protein BDK51DRAFT_48099 [Blyttiomyces helicus]